MTAFRVAVTWRLPLAVLMGGALVVVVLLLGDVQLRLPMTDGPRLARQAALLVAPLALSVLLTPPLPIIHASLQRSSLHHRVALGAFWTLVVAVCAVAWLGGHIEPDLMRFEMTSTFALSAATVFLVPRLGGRTLVGLSLAGCVWLLYGHLLAGPLGFGDLAGGGADPSVPAAGPESWLAVAVSLLACVLASAAVKPTGREG